MSGRLVYVVGPSGVGKDSLLAWLVQHWPSAVGSPRLHLARRTITREPSQNGEIHESTDPNEFAQLQAAGALAMDWVAHGLHYGIRATELAPLASGMCVLVNGSREALPQVAQRYPHVVVLHITASSHTLQARLQSRQRESMADVQRRMVRAPDLAVLTCLPCVEVVNDGTFESACGQMLTALQVLLAMRPLNGGPSASAVGLGG